MRYFEILFVNILVCLIVVLNLDAWKLINKNCCGNVFNGSSLMSKWNQGIIKYKEKLKWPDTSWHFDDIHCNISCHFISCGIKQRPTNDEMCQEARYKNHTCCYKLMKPVAETTEQKLTDMISTKESGTSTSLTTYSTITIRSTDGTTISLSSLSPFPNITVTMSPVPEVSTTTTKPSARNDQQEKKIKTF